jgi:hypothetical protein
MTSADSSGRTLSRRRFLRTSTAALAAPAIVRGQNLNGKLQIAAIGVGGRGAGTLAVIVALCDVNENNLKAAAGRHPEAKTFIDFRQLYADLKDFDAVVVSTAEHTHALATLPALRAGKHVYCEKPLTHNVREARLIREAARKAKVATQMGTQILPPRRRTRPVRSHRRGHRSPCLGLARMGPAVARRR